MADLLALAERCEEATGPDREIDCSIAVAALGFFKDDDGKYAFTDAEGVTHQSGQADDMLVRRFTASLDAAMTLAGDVFGIELSQRNDGGWNCALSNSQEDGEGTGRTMALAICAAALRARHAQTQSEAP
jgi:hypothetical protein